MAQSKEKTVKSTTAVAEKATKFSIPVYDAAGKVVDQFEIGKEFFDKNINYALLAQAVRVYQTNTFQGNSDTKTRSEVRGGGRKPWKQKGTGRARTGSIRGAQWRGGGIIFGPTPYQARLKLNQGLKNKALVESIKDKVQNQGLILVKEMKFETISTKAAGQFLKALPTNKKSLILTDGASELVLKSFRNLENVSIDELRNVNAYQVLTFNALVTTEASFKKLLERAAK